MSRAGLDARVLGWIAEGAGAPRDDARFEALALDLFRYQHAHDAPYRKLCHALGRSPDDVKTWRDIPPVPTGAFKEARLATFPASATVRVFRTSGSTTQARGALHLDTLAVYDASLLATFGAYIAPEALRGERLRFAVLAPSAEDAPDSSLSYMFDRAVRAFGTPESRFHAGAGGWRPERVMDDLAGARGPVAVVGTAFAFVHLIDAGARLELPEGSRAMETGGFKGRSRELERDALHAEISRALGVPPERIVNQYGMCELGSQFYEPTLVTGRPARAKRVPPWVRTRAVDPATLDDVPDGETGVLVHYDLANTGSVLAVQTSDAGRIAGEDGDFEVLGRIEGAEARGCSIAADALLGEAAGG